MPGLSSLFLIPGQYINKYTTYLEEGVRKRSTTPPPGRDKSGPYPHSLDIAALVLALSVKNPMHILGRYSIASILRLCYIDRTNIQSEGKCACQTQIYQQVLNAAAKITR